MNFVLKPELYLSRLVKGPSSRAFILSRHDSGGSVPRPLPFSIHVFLEFKGRVMASFHLLGEGSFPPHSVTPPTSFLRIPPPASELGGFFVPSSILPPPQDLDFFRNNSLEDDGLPTPEWWVLSPALPFPQNIQQSPNPFHPHVLLQERCECPDMFSQILLRRYILSSPAILFCL